MPLGTEDNAEELLALLYANGPSNVVALANAAAITCLDPSVASFQSVTIAQNTTFTLPPARAGAEFTLEVVQDATGSRTGTFTVGTGAVKFSGGSKTLSTVAASVDQISFWSDGTNWYGNLLKAFA